MDMEFGSVQLVLTNEWDMKLNTRILYLQAPMYCFVLKTHTINVVFAYFPKLSVHFPEITDDFQEWSEEVSIMHKQS